MSRPWPNFNITSGPAASFFLQLRDIAKARQAKHQSNITNFFITYNLCNFPAGIPSETNRAGFLLKPLAASFELHFLPFFHFPVQHYFARHSKWQPNPDYLQLSLELPTVDSSSTVLLTTLQQAKATISYLQQPENLFC
jgi:hypothetical protein